MSRLPAADRATEPDAELALASPHGRARARARRNRRIGRGAIAAGAVVAILGLIIITAAVSPVEAQRDTAVAQRNDLAADARQDATTIAALCATGSDVAKALDAAGQCGRAAARLADPVVAAGPQTLTQDQINDIVARVRTLTPDGASVDQVVNAVLERFAADPTLRGLSEDQVRSIVAAMLADAAPRDGRDGTSFAGLTFGREDGRCVATVTFREPDGSSRTERTTVGDGACAPATRDPDPPVRTPDPTTAPEPTPAPTTPPEPTPAPTTPPEPTDPPATTDGGGLLGG